MEGSYTQEKLGELTVYDLRVILRQLGGTPGSKNRSDLISEIMGIQNGEIAPKQNKRGRRPKELKIEEYIDDARKNGEKTDIDNGVPPYERRFASSDNTYTKDDVFVDVITDMHDSGFDNIPEEKPVIASGILEIMQEGYGFLRHIAKGKKQPDFYVDRQMIKFYNLKTGDEIIGYGITKSQRGSMYLSNIAKINGIRADDFSRNFLFEDLTATYPDSKFILSENGESSLRIIDLLAPIGKGQRGLIVAPPKTGKTTLLKQLANALENSYPDVHLMVLLIGERPEEVTEFITSVERGEVCASTFDEAPEKHIKCAQLCYERAKRLAESGKDVVILMDSLTRLTRAVNTAIPTSGKILSGGLDPQALTFPKKIFGSARKLLEGGTLTIIATALTETGSRMDDVIFEEFKGTGNMEIVLSRELAERRVFPAIDLVKSGTRREEKLLTNSELEASYKIRKMLSTHQNGVGVFAEMLKRSSDNKDLIKKLDGWIKSL